MLRHGRTTRNPDLNVFTGALTGFRASLAMGVLCAGSAQPLPAAAPLASAPQAVTTSAASASPEGQPLSPEAVAKLLPATVYFQGKTAPIQLRNAAAVPLGGAIVWAALVDTSGYASEVQERYQFYLVTEIPLLVGQTTLAAGAYGGGFLGERFLVMDLGGHTVAEGDLHQDPGMKRPRPLQMLPDSPDTVKLYLGRRWVQVKAVPRQR